MQFQIYTLAKLEHPWYPDTMRSDGPDGPDGSDPLAAGPLAADPLAAGPQGAGGPAHPTRHFSRCFSFRNQCSPPFHRPIISKWDGLAVEMYQFGRNRLARARRLLLKLCSLCRPKV